jgi:hypothetical protein
MQVLGYTYSNGTAFCADHATDTTDPNNETGQAYAIYNWEEAHSNITCDVDNKIILAQNCIDECEGQ